MAEKHVHTKVRMQDASGRPGPAAASYPERNFTTSPKYLPSTTALVSCYPLKNGTLSWTRRRRGSGRALVHEAGHGNVYVSWRSPLYVPRSAPSLLGSQAQPATNPAFVLLQGWLSIRSGAGSSRLGGSVHSFVEAAAPGLDRRGDWGVPLLGLNYVLHPLFKCMGARGVCTWAQVLPLRWVTGGGAARFIDSLLSSQKSTTPCPRWEDGTPSSINLRSSFHDVQLSIHIYEFGQDGVELFISYTVFWQIRHITASLPI